MKAIRGTRRSLRAPVLFAAVAGLALSASGCIIDSSDNNNTVCSPDLTIPWSLRSNIDSAILTCLEAGNADTITAWIDGGGLGSVLTRFDTACPAASTSGSFIALLPTSGTYNVSVELWSGATLLSETPVLVQNVDCSGLSRTPNAEFLVNF